MEWISGDSPYHLPSLLKWDLEKEDSVKSKGLQVNLSGNFSWYNWRGKKKSELLIKKFRQGRKAMLRFLKGLKHCAPLDEWAEFLKHGKAETEASYLLTN